MEDCADGFANENFHGEGWRYSFKKQIRVWPPAAVKQGNKFTKSGKAIMPPYARYAKLS